MASAPGDEDAVLTANTAFYLAFEKRDVAAMEELWARGPDVACVHPGWAPLFGRAAVLASWEGILEAPSAPSIACMEARAHLLGDSAFVVCTERLPEGDLVATNLFVREDERWKLVHHQAGPAPPASDPPASGTVH